MNGIFRFSIRSTCLLAILIGISLGDLQGSNSYRVFIQSESVPLANRKVLLILPGFGDTKKRRKAQLAYFSHRGYDVFIPHYRDRRSYEATIKNLQDFIEERQLDAYQQVNVFSYIVGSWALNEVLNRKSLPNLSHIIYNRSPLQERAPVIVRKKLKILGRIKVGRMLEEFADIPYPNWNPNPGIKVGLLIECKATPLIKFFRRYTLSLGPLCWNPSCFQQPHDAVHYTWLNHNQMYTHMEVIGPHILHFLEEGSFAETARTKPYQWDHFAKYAPIQ